ncbi:conserved hypothetical protein [Ricinus communis]|uniref:Uncharacterized protein n=1 Tax=Ricinus communis TaxID=3988 RepID=B9SSI6_RICCO|nr:conserved hypothetical protein [Ricinus communis]
MEVYEMKNFKLHAMWSIASLATIYVSAPEDLTKALEREQERKVIPRDGVYSEN